MKTNEKEQKGVKYTHGNSSSPLPGVRSADLQPNKNADHKGTSKDVSELERKRVERVEAEEAKKQKTREGKK